MFCLAAELAALGAAAAYHPPQIGSLLTNGNSNHENGVKEEVQKMEDINNQQSPDVVKPESQSLPDDVVSIEVAVNTYRNNPALHFPVPLDHTITPSKDQLSQLSTSATIVDTRYCVLCGLCGDLDSVESWEGRLLPIPHVVADGWWIHTLCALWSTNVYLNKHGNLEKMPDMIRQAATQFCSGCGQPGATLLCCSSKKCRRQYHFNCARKYRCAFTITTRIYCPEHAERAAASKLCQPVRIYRSLNIRNVGEIRGLTINNGEFTIPAVLADTKVTTSRKRASTSAIDQHSAKKAKREQTEGTEHEETTEQMEVEQQHDQYEHEGENESAVKHEEMEAEQPEESKPVISTVPSAPQSAILRIGALSVLNLGSISTNPSFYTSDYIFPVNYAATRLFWSYKHPHKRVRYTCTITQRVTPLPLQQPIISPSPVDSSTVDPSSSTSCSDLPSLDAPLDIQPSPSPDFIDTHETETSPLFSIEAEDDTGRLIEASSAAECWTQLMKLLPQHQQRNGVRRKGPSGDYLAYGLNGAHFFGFGLPVVQSHIETLPHAGKCGKYKFKYHSRPEDDDTCKLR